MEKRLSAHSELPLILGVEEIKQILGIGQRRAYEIMEQQGFPLVRIGRLKRVQREDFFNWLDQQKEVSN